jgi:hypothetical protein
VASRQGAQEAMTFHSHRLRASRPPINVVASPKLPVTTNEPSAAVAVGVRAIRRAQNGWDDTGRVCQPKKGRKLFGRPAKPAPMTVSYIYVLRCRDSGHEYGANSADVWLRQCSSPGLAFMSLWKTYAAAISRVALTGSRSTLQSADRFSSRGRQ